MGPFFSLLYFSLFFPFWDAKVAQNFTLPKKSATFFAHLRRKNFVRSAAYLFSAACSKLRRLAISCKIGTFAGKIY
jgi:hypothetical protein